MQLKYYIKQFLASLIYFLGGVLWLKLLYWNKSRLIILNYHNFSKYNNYKINRGDILETGFAVNFENQIKFIKKHFNFCYTDNYFSRKAKRGLNILITFDDGYKDNFDIALPLLKKHEASAIFFITTSYIETSKWLWHDKVRYLATKGELSKSVVESQLKQMNNGQQVNAAFENLVKKKFIGKLPKRLMMSWEEVGILNNDFPIGAHTCNHSILASMKKQEQEKEISDSIKALKNNLGIHSKHFAYPNGLYNTNTLNLLTKNHVEFGYTTTSGVNSFDSKKLELKRIGVNASDSIPVLLLKLLLNSFK